MAFPWISEANFEDGTRQHFDSETDSDSKLDFAHFSEIARTPGIAMPYNGAYAMRVNIALGTNDAFVQENDDWDMAAAETQYWRWMLWVDPNITMADGNEFVIFRLQSSGPTDEVVCVINFTDANGLRIGVGGTVGANFLPLTTNVWHSIEIEVTLDSGAGNDGTITLWVDGGQATQVTGQDQAAIVQGRLGAMGIDAGTTAGVILFDEVLSDDARLFPEEIRFPTTLTLTLSGHVFAGHGKIDNITLLSGAATDNVVSIFDTDTADINDSRNILAELKNTANNEVVDPAGMPVIVRRGCYVSMTGTNPRALINIARAPAYGSDGAIRSFAAKRTTPGGI